MAIKRKRMLGSILIGAAILAVALILIVRLAVRHADTALVDFAALKRPSSPNTALACAKDTCPSPDLVTEPVALSAVALAARVPSLLEQEPRVTIAAGDPAAGRFVLIQRSLVFDFPDTVNIAVQAVDDGHATLAIYSRSNYGRSDLGINKARVKRWLDRLGVPWHAAG
jgi:uncharacterized protein (DUF1499 family)